MARLERENERLKAANGKLRRRLDLMLDIVETRLPRAEATMARIDGDDVATRH